MGGSQIFGASTLVEEVKVYDGVFVSYERLLILAI